MEHLFVTAGPGRWFKEGAMSVASVQEAFEQFEHDVVRVPPDQVAAAKEIHPAIRAILEEGLPGKVQTFLCGSYARKTQVAPALKDVDLVCVLEDPDGVFAGDAAGTQARVQAVAVTSELVLSTERCKRAVKLSLRDHEFTVDVVPALVPGDGDGLLIPLCIPDEGCNLWALANPKGQVEAARERNRACEGVYVPAVRLVKFWNTSFGRGKPLRSYHAEALVWHALAEVDEALDLANAMALFFDHAYEALAPGLLVTDPGNPTAYVDERMTAEERRRAREKVAVARDHVQRAVEAEKLETQLTEWAKVFGPSFPTTVDEEEALQAALSGGTATAVGAGIATGAGRVLIPARSWRSW